MVYPLGPYLGLMTHRSSNDCPAQYSVQQSIKIKTGRQRRGGGYSKLPSEEV